LLHALQVAAHKLNDSSSKHKDMVMTALSSFKKRKKPATRIESRAFKEDPAATYSPTQKIMQYHRRREA
jgi:hypothetical protein